MLQRFSEDLTALQRAIRWGDGDELFDLFTRTRAIRRSIIEQGQDDRPARLRRATIMGPIKGLLLQKKKTTARFLGVQRG